MLKWIIKRLRQTLLDKTYSPKQILAGKYQIEKVLGDGSYGIVYLCTSLLSNKRCVVKQLRKRKRNENESMYLQETTVLKMLNHPAIPAFLETFTDNNTLFFSMEYMEGDNIEDILFSKKETFTELEALIILRDLLEVIEYMHSKGIAHGDIRIPNIMMNHTRLYLIDFGLTQFLRNEENKSIVQDDFYDLGDFLLFMLYSTYSAKPKKNQPWTEELTLNKRTISILKRLLQVEQPYESAKEILADVNQAIHLLSH
ncbi:protein kinase family protein [Gracilibacillus ureilyticus]|nr:protein kinase family protein [Gracilibacillus ureilyticus]